ncbi:hypothetical protein SCLCIDRAFT_98428, partial [Scleroderma citrinum Foug A]
IFDSLPSLAKKALPKDELDRYLAADIESITNALKWWYDHQTTYPCLSRMAMDYLIIPATSVDVERLFSCSHTLSH